MTAVEDMRAKARADLLAAHDYELHTAASRIVAAREDRDEAIRQAFADGMPVRRIAEGAELTTARVYQLVRGSA